MQSEQFTHNIRRKRVMSTDGKIIGQIKNISFITLVSASTIDPALKGQLEEVDKTGAAKMVGKLVAERALAAGIKDIVFDRGGYLYTGRIAALADAAREAGLNF